MDMEMCKKGIFFLALLFSGIFLFDHAVSLLLSTRFFFISKVEYLVSLSLGILFVGLGLSHVLVVADLLPLDVCVVNVFSLLMMPVFELIMGAEIYPWVWFIWIPTTFYNIYVIVKKC